MKPKLEIDRRKLVSSAGLAGLALAGASAIASDARKQSANRSRGQYRAWQIGAQQGIDSLQLREMPRRELLPGEVRIDVRAAALNHRDLQIMVGRYGGPKPPARVPLGDGAGVVIEIGAEVANVAVGDRVSAPHFRSWLDGAFSPEVFQSDLGNSVDGWLAAELVLPAVSLVKIPASLSLIEAAALPAAGVTAWTVLRTFAQVRPGETVLVLGTGGVSIIALQLARMAGARVAITSSSDDKLAIAQQLGADILVNYRRTPDWQQEVLKKTDGVGVDIVVETVGWASIERSAACCAPNARIGLLGALEAPAVGVNPAGALIRKNITLKGITSGSRRELEEVFAAFATNKVRPRVDRAFTFDEALAAYRYLDDGDFVGKVVISRN